jgi:hypothetical protein
MLRDAALFHLELFERLGARGLTLKGLAPLQRPVRWPRPRFVDFTSIIPSSELKTQKHLSHAPARKGIARFWDDDAVAVYESYRLMYEPYFGLPLEMMKRGRHNEARRRLYETLSTPPTRFITRREVFGSDRLGGLLMSSQTGGCASRFWSRVRKSTGSFGLSRSTSEGWRFAVKGSAYSSYYEEKHEAFSTEPSPDWNPKQHSVRNTIVERRPRTVLDFGSNTGWFSILAARLGCSVVAVIWMKPRSIRSMQTRSAIRCRFFLWL